MNLRSAFISAIVFLVLAKVIPIWHLTLSESLYFDIDRLLALVLFLVSYYMYSQSKFEAKPYLWLLLGGLMLSGLAPLLGVAFERMFILFFMTALVEEILLRGVLFEWLLTKLSAKWVLISTSLFFTLVHPAVYQSIEYALAVLITGFVLGGCYLYFRDKGREMAIVYATVMHGLIILLGLKLGFI